MSMQSGSFPGRWWRKKAYGKVKHTRLQHQIAKNMVNNLDSVSRYGHYQASPTLPRVVLYLMHFMSNSKAHDTTSSSRPVKTTRIGIFSDNLRTVSVVYMQWF